MLMSSEIARWERQFDEDIRLLSVDVKNKLDTNEAVLAGFSAFLKAIDRSDTESATRYASVVTAAYPHIYMMEVARKLPVSEEEHFEAALRTAWQSDFRLRDFTEITQRPPVSLAGKTVTWPILFMYPSLPTAKAIYGLRLETVDYLVHTLALAHENKQPVVSPVFSLYEGGTAFILLQEVVRPTTASKHELNFFWQYDGCPACHQNPVPASQINHPEQYPEYPDFSIPARRQSGGEPALRERGFCLGMAGHDFPAGLSSHAANRKRLATGRHAI